MAVDIETEIAEAMGVPAQELVAMKHGETGVDGMGLTYNVADADKAAWRPAWRLEIGPDGLEYGKPMKLPKNTVALATYLAKRRKDGGRLFTLAMPERILGPGQFECFVAPEMCSKRTDTKAKLVDHMEACHPRESQHYAPFIKQIRDSIAHENPRLQELVAKIAATPDRPPVQVPEAVRAEHNADLPQIPEPVVETLNVTYACPMCDYKPDVTNSKPAQALGLHMRSKHGLE